MRGDLGAFMGTLTHLLYVTALVFGACCLMVTFEGAFSVGRYKYGYNFKWRWYELAVVGSSLALLLHILHSFAVGLYKRCNTRVYNKYYMIAYLPLVYSHSFGRVLEYRFEGSRPPFPYQLPFRFTRDGKVVFADWAVKLYGVENPVTLEQQNVEITEKKKHEIRHPLIV